jgi:transposase
LARYKHFDYGQTKLLPISFERQILPGSFEHTLSYVIDYKVDLSAFHAHYKNDKSGAPAYHPALLLKIILFAYSKGITSSRDIESLCKHHAVFIALSADTMPHFTTIANFVSSLGQKITRVFCDVLLVCDEAGLVGREMFAIDGVKLPSNASKEWSGTKADLKKKADKMQRAMEYCVNQHRTNDRATGAPLKTAAEKQIKTLQQAIEKIESFRAKHEEKLGKSGKAKQSNITDNESAKMPTSKGVIQGYNGIALVDAKHQIIVHAEAHGEGAENGLLQPMLSGVRATFKELKLADDVLKQTKITADAGYSSEVNARYLFENDIDAYVADTFYRKRDPRFATADRHKPTKPDAPFAKPKKPPAHFQNTDFQLTKDQRHCVCPAGKQLARQTARVTVEDFDLMKFRGSRSSCGGCVLRSKCLRHPERTPFRQVAFFLGRTQSKPEKYLTKMKRKIDTDHGRYQYSRRLGTVEPVFGNIRHTHGLNRFSLRGKEKVNAQWHLFCLVHNIGKVQRYGAHVMTTKSRTRRKTA